MDLIGKYVHIFLLYDLLLVKNCLGENIELYKAIKNRHLNETELVRLVNLTTIDDLNMEDSEGQTPLLLSVLVGNKNAFDLIKNRVAVDNILNKHSQTLLHLAVIGGDLGIIESILEDNEISLNAQDKDGNTAMHYVALGKPARNITEICKTLLEEGALLTLKNSQNKTPYHLAVLNKLIHVLEIMLNFDEFLNLGVRIQDENGHTPLQIALDKNLTEIFKLLINHSANPFEQDLNKRTIIHNAVLKDDINSLKITLLSKKTFRGEGNRIIPYHIGLGYTDIHNYTALHWAVERGLIEAVDLILGFEKVSIRTSNYYNNTLLHSTIIGGSSEILKKLLDLIKEGDSYINAQNKDGHTALHLAVQEGMNNMTELLLSKRANGFIYDFHDFYPVGLAASFGTIDTVKLFKTYNYTQNHLYNATELLAFAIANGNDQTVIDELFNDIQDKFELTFLAPAKPFERVISTICHLICSVKVDNCTINTPEQTKVASIIRTITADHEKLITELAEEDEDESSDLFDSKPTLLNYALFFNGNLDNVQEIINCTSDTICDICTINESWSPVDIAAFRGKSEIVIYLIKICKDKCRIHLTDMKDQQGQTVTHKAAWGGQCEILKYLYNKENADINVKDKWGRTPLHVAALRGYRKAIDCILQLDKSSLNMKDKYDFTPLHLAEIYGHHKFFSVLQQTSITLAPEVRYHMKFPGTKNRLRNHTDVIHSLLEKGADPNAQDQTLGWTMLHWAASNGDIDVVKMLLNDKIKAKVNLPSQNDQTPMYVARFWGRTDVYNYLKLHDAVW